jgi:threonine dehydratase
MIIPKTEIEAAQKRIEKYLQPTPLLRSAYYSNLLGANIYLKLETLQPTHSFKVRGAFNALLALGEEKRQRGVITASGGNHGLGVALAAATLKVPATIYLPTATPALKIDAIRRLGAEVVLFGSVWDEANQTALKVAAEEDKAYIHPFDHAQVMAGQGTLVCELLTQLDGVDVLVASIGGGGLISGMISGAKHFSPLTRVVGVETIGADCMYQSRAAGEIVELPAITSIAESLGAKKTEARQFAIVQENVFDLTTVSDEEAIASVLEVLREEKLLLEPAAACCLAALTNGQIEIQANETIVVVACGGNIALEKIAGWLGSRENAH